MFARIEAKKRKLDEMRPLPVNTLKTLLEQARLEWTYHSNAIEGNTLTLKETRVVLEGITVGGKTLKEHVEVINHQEAVLYLEDLIQKKSFLSEWDIKNIHQLVLKGIDDRNAGVYRTENVVISEAKHVPPPHYLVQEQMEQLMDKYQNEWQDIHPVQRAALLHGEFVKIHPFVDGNGRTVRLLINFELMKVGYPPAIIRKKDRLKYYEALDEAHVTGDYQDFTLLVARCVERSLDWWLKVLLVKVHSSPP